MKAQIDVRRALDGLNKFFTCSSLPTLIATYGVSIISAIVVYMAILSLGYAVTLSTSSLSTILTVAIVTQFLLAFRLSSQGNAGEQEPVLDDQFVRPVLKFRIPKGNPIFLRSNLPNAVSLFGVLPLIVLLTPAAPAWLPFLIVYNNFMGDLDGMLARWMKVESHFDVRLANVCDAAAHTLITLAVGAQIGGLAMWVAMVPAAAILIRLTSLLPPEGPNKLGSTTNELMRHLLFLLLLGQAFNFNVRGWAVAVFLVHAFTLVTPIRMPYLLGTLAPPWAVLLINLALAVAVAAASPVLTVVIAFLFFATYVMSFQVGLVGEPPEPKRAETEAEEPLEVVQQGRKRG